MQATILNKLADLVLNGKHGGKRAFVIERSVYIARIQMANDSAPNTAYLS